MDTHAVVVPSAPGPRFRTELTVRGDVVVVAVSGEVDIADGDQLGDHLSTALMLAERAVVLDLSRLQFCDPGGLRAMAAARAEAFRRGIPFCIAAPSRPVSRLLDLVGSASIPVHDTVRTAVLRYSRRQVVVELRPATRVVNGG